MVDEYLLSLDDRLIRVDVVDRKEGNKTVVGLSGSDDVVRVLPHGS
jgi:hypothetical protein